MWCLNTLQKKPLTPALVARWKNSGCCGGRHAIRKPIPLKAAEKSEDRIKESDEEHAPGLPFATVGGFKSRVLTPPGCFFFSNFVKVVKQKVVPLVGWNQPTY